MKNKRTTSAQYKIKKLLKLEASSPVEFEDATSGKRIEWQLPNGVIHRVFGPAVIYGNVSHCWVQNGQLHREDGPAIVFEGKESLNQYWINGKYLNKEAFEERWQFFVSKRKTPP